MSMTSVTVAAKLKNMSMYACKASWHVRTQGTLACEHARHIVSMQDTLAHEHVSVQGTLAHEHIVSTQGMQFS